MIPEANDGNSSFGEEFFAFLITHLSTNIVMSPAIEFDRELHSRAIKVEYVRIEGMLSPKLIACEVPVAQVSPKDALIVRGLFAK